MFKLPSYRICLSPDPISAPSHQGSQVLSNDDIKLKVVSLLDLVIGRNVPTINVQDCLLSPLTLPRTGPLRRITIILRQSLDTGNIITKTSDSVNPGLVVVNAHSDEERFLVLLRLEAQHAGGAAAAHGEGQDAVLLVPLGAVAVVPAAFLHDMEVGVGVGLENADFDGVGHSGGVSGSMEVLRGD